MADGYLAGHRMTQNGQDAEERKIWKTSTTGEEPRTYRTDFPAKGGQRSCLEEGCLGRAATRTDMRVHFMHRNVLYTVVILEEGNPPNPQ